MAKISMKPLQWVAYILVAVGALNWGLVGLLNFNLVDTVLGWIGLTGFTTWVYAAIGIAGALALAKIWY